MSIIEKYKPLNSEAKIDQMMVELKAVPGAMKNSVYYEIFGEIQKRKLQEYFKEKYPEADFNDSCAGTPGIPVNKSGSSEVNTDDIHFFPEESKGDKKYIYGTYFEMAFHNFFLTLSHIYAQTFGEVIDLAERDFESEMDVWNPMFRRFRQALPEESLKASDLFDKHFPFLKPFLDYTGCHDECKRFDKIEILKRLSQILRVVRHYYSHREISLFESQRRTLNYNMPMVMGALDTVFLASKRVIKQRFAYDDNAMRCAEQFKVVTDRENRDRNGRPLKKKVEIEGFKYRRYTKGENGDRCMTPFGMVLLAALFLEKKYAKIFADKLHVVMDSDTRIIGEMMSVYRLQLKVQRLSVTKAVDALAMDIIGELQRCPKELFELLPPEEQRSFRVVNEQGDEVLMVRHTDRFPHLVMKYIDEARLFSDIRFQVSLGKYFYKFYDKKCIDGSPQPRVRSLSKDIHGFGRLSEIEEARKAVWADVIRDFDEVHRNSADEKPYITDHHASYVLNGGRIGMRIFDGEGRSFMPELTSVGASSLPPSCWMSVYELPAMMFLMYLQGSDRVEEIIKQCVSQYRCLFEAIHKGKLQPFTDDKAADAFLRENFGGIKLRDIPQTLQSYLCADREIQSASLEDRTKALVDDLIEQTLYKIEKLKSDRQKLRFPQQNKIGKKSYVQIRPGRLASFMAKDIMFFQPCKEDKLTGLNFRILQSVLATYSGDTAALGRSLEAAHLLGNPGEGRCNPIVSAVWSNTVKPGDTVGFYKAYLEARLSYLKQCREKADWASLPFVHADKVKWQVRDADFCRAKAGRYLRDEYGGTSFEKAIELPRGLFDSFIREELASMTELREIASDPSKNMAYLIYAYFMRIKKDDCQSFYNARRCYPLLDKLYRKSTRDPHQFLSQSDVRALLSKEKKAQLKSDMDKALQSVRYNERDKEREHLKRLIGEMKDNETLLKRYKVQDMMMLLMAKSILLNEHDGFADEVQQHAVESIHLSDLLEGEALSQKIKVRMQVESKRGYKKTIVKENVKMKDYGRLYHILQDRRLPSLLDLVRYNTINHDMIEQELGGYDKVHPMILKNVFGYEENYTEGTGKPIADSFSGMVYEDDRLRYDQKKALKVIRNAFAHFAYPYDSSIQVSTQEDLPQKAERISEKFIKEIESIDSNNESS